MKTPSECQQIQDIVKPEYLSLIMFLVNHLEALACREISCFAGLVNGKKFLTKSSNMT